MEQKNEEIVVVFSGYFDPIHVGHLEGLMLAKQLGHKLIAVVNSDHQARLKKGYAFMPQEERAEILKHVKWVDEVFISIDTDQTQCKTLAHLKPHIFAKGGDRTSDEIPEAETCKLHGIKIIDGLGAKRQSSSWLIENSKKNQATGNQ